MEFGVIIFFNFLLMVLLAFGKGVDIELELLDASKHHAISKEYRQGEYLIYDCEGHYFTCVDIDSYRDCQNKRFMAWKTRQLHLSCAPLKGLPSIDLCIEQQYRLIFNGSDKTFCLSRRFNPIF